jgi:hypothetical protein
MVSPLVPFDLGSPAVLELQQRAHTDDWVIQSSLHMQYNNSLSGIRVEGGQRFIGGWFVYTLLQQKLK